MEKADEISDKRTSVAKNRTCENKQQTTSETSNLESGSSSYNTFSENADSKLNMKNSHKNKLQNGLIENHSSGDADNNSRSQNVEEFTGRRLDCEVEKSSLSSDEYENSKVSVGNQKEPLTRRIKKEVAINSDGGNPHEEPPDYGLEEEKVVNESSLQSHHHADESDEADAGEHDVKVCDICGDAGREDLLAICCRCLDGAEHTYCMKVMIDKVPEGDWLCEECKLEDEENKKPNRQKYGVETGAVKDLSSDAVVKVSSGKRRAEELEFSSSFKKQALETITGSTKDVDRGKMKPSHHFSSDSSFGNDSTEAARSPATRPRLQSLRGAFSKSNSFSFPNARSKSKLVDEAVLQRQKSTKELPSHEAREMGKSMSFRSTNLGRFGASGSKVKMLPSHQDLKNPKFKQEKSFERNISAKSSTPSSAAAVALAPKVDKLPASRGETTPVSSGSNSEVKSVKGECKSSTGIKSTSRPANISAEVPVSLAPAPAPANKQLPSSPTKVGSASSSGIIGSNEQKSIPLKEDNLSKLSTSKESTNLTDGIKELSTTSHLGSGVTPAQVSSGNNVAAMGSSKEMKHSDNKLKDAIEAALLKKPGIYRKNRISDESSVSSMNSEVPIVDRVPHSRNAGNSTSAEVATDWHGQISRNSNVDHSKQSNGNNFKQSMILPAEGKHLTTENSSYDAMVLPSHSKVQAIPDLECIWQGSFEINRSGKAAEFWDGLQAHLSTCASPRVSEAVNKLPHKILLNGVSRVSAWPSQFEISGVKEDNIAIYFFAKDVESYEKSYQVLLDDMIRGDLALIGSINGVELLIFPSNQLPEKSNRWNMLFFLWGVFRGKRKNSLNQVPNNPENNCVPQDTSSTSTDKMLSGDAACLHESINKDKHVDSESKGNSKLQILSQTKEIDGISIQLDGVNLVPPVTDGNAPVPNNSDSQDLVKFSRNLEMEPRKRAFIDLSEDDDVTTTNQINTSRDAGGRVSEEGNAIKKQKSDLYGKSSNLASIFNTVASDEKTVAGNSNGERYFFPLIGSSFSENQQQTAPPKMKLALDLNEDISCLAGETDDVIMTENHEDNDADVASSLSLSLAFSRPVDKDEDRGKGKCHSASSMLLFRDMVDK